MNRGQRDIEQKKAISGALENERVFFETHQSYKNKAQYCGTPFLARKLNTVSLDGEGESRSDDRRADSSFLRSVLLTQLLMHHIRATLPDIKIRIQTQLQRYQTELASLGGAMGAGNGVRPFLSSFSSSSSI